MKGTIGLGLVAVMAGLWGTFLPMEGRAQGEVPPGLLEAPPCVSSDEMPATAKVPCAGLVEFKPGVNAQARADVIRGRGATLRFNFKHVNAVAVLISDNETLAALESDPDVVAMIPDRRVHKIAKPENPGNGKGNGNKDPEPTGQEVGTGVARIGAAPGSLSVTGSGVGVAIADTGLDFAHGDLNVAPECFTAFSQCQDDDGHGSHVGGIVAALDNDIDTVGVAPDATLYAVKVLNHNGSGSDSTVMMGLEWVADNADLVDPPIRAVNMSLGREGELDDNPLLRAAVQAVTDLGISVIVSAGNDQYLEVEDNVTSTYPEVMAIASTTAVDGANSCKWGGGDPLADTASYFTTDGLFDEASGIGVTISAPGAQKEEIKRNCFIQSTGILSLKLGGGTTRMSGTSMSAPHVTGVVALMVEDEGAAIDPEVVRDRIMASADGIGVAPLDSLASSYTFDGEREGILSACGVLGEPCP